MDNITINSTIDNAKTYDLEPPIPLIKELPLPSVFPYQDLLKIPRNAVMALEKKTMAPCDIRGQSVLSVMALAAQGHIDIMLPLGSVKPVSLMQITIAESGARKTTVDNLAMKAVLEKERVMAQGFIKKRDKWKNENAVYEKTRSSILKSIEKDSKDNSVFMNSEAERLDKIGKAPPKPLDPTVIFEDITTEGVAKYFQAGQPSIGIFSDEGGKVIGGYSFNKENQTKSIGDWCKLWDGSPIKILRSSTGSVVIYGKRASIHWMMQPVIAREFLWNNLFQGQGLLSRALISAPVSRIGERFQDGIDCSADGLLEGFHERISELLDIPLPLGDSYNDLQPRTVVFSADAESAWWAFYNTVEAKLGKGGDYHEITNFTNKLAEQAARIAAVFAFFDNPDCKEITLKYLNIGIILAEYYGEQIKYLHDKGYSRPEITKAIKMLEWLHGSKWKEPFISVPDAMHYAPNSLRDKRICEQCFKILEEHNWIHPLSEGRKIGKHNRRKVWKIVEPQDNESGL